jgi:hypothetical protein
MKAIQWAIVVASTTAVVATSASCLDPTEITLSVTTDVRCSDTKGAAFSGGSSPSAVEGANPNATTLRCQDGQIGTLVATPSGSKDTDAAFVVTLGVDRPVRECTPANHYHGCIVQRRAIRYTKHKPIELPIVMRLACKDVECDVDSTCARNGKCVPARVDGERCANGSCFPEGDPPGVDAGGGDPDGATTGDGGATTDGSSDARTDAAVDAGFVVPPLPSAGQIYCPPVSNGCSNNGTTPCCWARDGSGGTCSAPCMVVETHSHLSCTRKVDCSAMGPDFFCCGGVDAPPGGPARLVGSYCTNACSLKRVVCVADADCPAGGLCNTTSQLFAPTGIFGLCGTAVAF